MNTWELRWTEHQCFLINVREREKVTVSVCEVVHDKGKEQAGSGMCVCGPGTLRLPRSQSRNLKIGSSACPSPGSHPGLMACRVRTTHPRLLLLWALRWGSALFLTTLETRRKLMQEQPSSPWTCIHTTPTHLNVCRMANVSSDKQN